MSPVKQSVMVATDFSESSRRAVEEAVELAEQMDRGVDIVHVVHPDRRSRMGSVRQLLAEEQRLEQLRSSVSGRVQVRAHLRCGNVVSGLLDVIEEVNPLLIMLGRHGHGGIRRALLGGLAQELRRRSPAPVMMVPAPPRDDGEGAAAEQAVARSCKSCGHILDQGEAQETCARCGQNPAAWDSALMSKGPVDTLEPAVGGDVGDPLASERTNDMMGLFSLSPPGIGGYDVNPELRVRY